jgi:hypothetical protein
MTSITGSQPMQTARLDRTLEYAVVQSWDELMPDSNSGLIHIEYQTGSDGSVDFLSVWTSTIRGHWNRVCEFWMKPLWSHATGLGFSSDPHSVDFAHTLELVMGRENAFLKLPDQHGLIQIHPPTRDERSAAARWMEVAFSR